MVPRFGIRAVSSVAIILVWVALIVGMLYVPDFIARWSEGKRVIRLLTFGGIIDPAYVRKFEEQTGIKVSWSYYSSNEELQAKLKKTGGKGYDLIVPSDYTVRILREQNFLKPLDHSRMPFLKSINPLLLNQPYDPGNRYSVPFEWELYGIGYDKQALGPITDASWKLLFTDPVHYRIIMLDDPIEAMQCAVQYLYGNQVELVTKEQKKEVRALLRTQKEWVEAYTSTRAGYYLATGSSPLAMTATSFIFTAQKYAPQLDFAIPAEGGFITIENLAIPAASEHDDLVYQLLAFLYTRESALHHFEEYANFPANADATFTELGATALPFVNMPAEQFKKLRFFKAVIPENQVRDFWVTVKT